MANTAAVVEREFLTPDWMNQWLLKFKANVAHTFVFTGNTRDLVTNQMGLEVYLSRKFLKPVKGKNNFDLVIFYDRANGLRFATDEMRGLFLQTCGQGKASAAVDAVMGKSKGDVTLPKDPSSVFDMVEIVLKTPRTAEDGRPMHCTFIIDYAESIMPAGSWSQLTAEDRDCIIKMLNWAKDPIISSNGNPIIMIADSAVLLHDTLISNASRIELVEILLPQPADRLSFIEFKDSEIDGERLKFEKDFDKAKFAHLTAGLKKRNIDDIKLTAEHRNVPIGPDIIKQRKAEIYKSEYLSVLEIVDPTHGFEVIGGYEWLKEYVKRDVIEPMLSGDIKRCAQGILMAGPSGTGKSEFARAMAFAARMNMVELNVGKLMGSLVGETEKNTAKAFLAIRSLVPVMVWMDEIDQSISRGSHGDSGVSNRIFKQLLEFMSDSSLRGRVLFVAATNRPDKLDPALKRRGRFDKIIPFLPPNEAQRAEIFPAVLRRYGHEIAGKVDFKMLGRVCVDWVGSDIEAAVIKAYEIARRDGREKLVQDDFSKALRLIVPASQDVKLWANLALRECSDIELLPPEMREGFSRNNIEEQIKQQSKDSTTLALEAKVRPPGEFVN